MTRLRRAALLGCVTLFVASVARAQVEPPPATSPPPAAPGAPATAPAPPPAPPPAAATAPVEPLSPTMAPDAASAPPLVLSERTEPLPVARPKPFYDRAWFWGTATLVVASVVLILLVNNASNDNGPPHTTFGNMHAF